MLIKDKNPGLPLHLAFTPGCCALPALWTAAVLPQLFFSDSVKVLKNGDGEARATAGLQAVRRREARKETRSSGGREARVLVG